MTTHKPAVWRLALAALSICFIATAAQAQQSRGVAYVSGYASDDSSGSAGFTLALQELGRGLAVRGSVMGGSYTYDSGPNGRIEADYTGFEAAVAHQTSGDWGYANVAVGARYTDTELSPGDPNNARAGGQWDTVATVDGARNMGDLRAAAFASYGFDMEEYYARIDLTHAVGASGLRLGAEAAAQGDDSYERQNYGAVAIASPRPEWEVRVSAGVSRQDDDTGAYATLGLVRLF